MEQQLLAMLEAVSEGGVFADASDWKGFEDLWARHFGKGGSGNLTESLAVDALQGQQQIVIEPLGERPSTAPGIAGGAAMPDGQVGPILDVAGPIRTAHGTNLSGVFEPQATPQPCESTA